jgi:hypothetical protein
MLFMVIERFKNGEIKAIGERFARDGRMLPPGVVYHVSWVDAVGVVSRSWKRIARKCSRSG